MGAKTKIMTPQRKRSGRKSALKKGQERASIGKKRMSVRVLQQRMTRECLLVFLGGDVSAQIRPRLSLFTLYGASLRALVRPAAPNARLRAAAVLFRASFACQSGRSREKSSFTKGNSI